MVLRQNIGKESSVEGWLALARPPLAVSQCRSRSEYEHDSIFTHRERNLRVLTPL
jgi:hypothetical protein